MTMTAPPTTTPPTAPPPGRRRLLRTRVRWIAGTTLLVVLGAAAFSFLQTPAYEATAQVVVLPLVSANGPTPQTPSMGTEQSLVLSDLVAGDAARKLGMPLLDLERAASVTVPAQTETLAITCTTTDAAFSARCAQSLAESYVAYKDSQPIQTLPERGRVITPAVPPLAPATPNLVLNLVAGLLVGLVLGFLVALLRDRLDSRVRVAEDLEQRGVRVLGVVPARGAGAGGGSGNDARARAFGALAVKVRSAVRESAGTGPAPVIVVTAIADEDTLEAPAVASALASALAAAGERVVAVNADTGSPTGTAPAPGLLDLLAGRLDLATALHPTAHPQLRTMSVGRRPPSRIGGPEWTRTAELLGASADLVVVAADPMLLSANGLTVAQGADAVVAVAVGRATTRSDVDAFVQECRELGLPLAGAALTVDTVRRLKQGNRVDQAERDGWGSWAEVLGSAEGGEPEERRADQEPAEEPAAEEPAAEEPAAEEPAAEEPAAEEPAAEEPAAEEPAAEESAIEEPERATAADEEEPVTVQTNGGPRVVPTTVVSPRKPSPLEGTARGRTENNGTGVHPVPPV